MILLKHHFKPWPPFLERVAEAFHSTPKVFAVSARELNFIHGENTYYSSNFRVGITNESGRYWQQGFYSSDLYLPVLGNELELLGFSWYELPLKPSTDSYMLQPEQTFGASAGIGLKNFQLECIKIYGEERIRRLDRYFNHKNSYPYHAADQLVDIGDYLFSIRYVILESSDQRQLVFSDDHASVCLKITAGFEPTALENNFYAYEELDTGINIIDYDEPAYFISKIPKIKLHYRIDAGGVHDFTYPEYRDIDKTP